MTEDQPAPETTTIPIIKDNGLRLAKMRRQLEGIFRKIDLIHERPAWGRRSPKPSSARTGVRHRVDKLG